MACKGTVWPPLRCEGASGIHYALAMQVIFVKTWCKCATLIINTHNAWLHYCGCDVCENENDA